MMTFSERMKEILDMGVTSSREFAARAGAKAQEFGERGVLMLEIKQLEVQAQRLIGRLGNEAYKAFAERKQADLSANDADIKPLLDELAKISETIENKEAELKEKRRA